MRRAVDVLEPDGRIARRHPRVGDFRWDGKVWRRWSGARWAKATHSTHPARLEDPRPLHLDPRLDEAVRRSLIARAVEEQVLANRATLVHEGPSGTVLSYPRLLHHGLHAILTLLTGGLWGIVWIALALTRNDDRIRLEADPWGNIWATRLAR